MRNLIQDLLIFSQINKEELQFREVDLNSIAQDAVQDFEISIEEKKARITVDSLPVIKGDQRMLSQLFNNLIGNALKYSRKDAAPEIFISSKLQNEILEISVKDNGIGFNEKYLPQMFTLFQRLHTRETYDGTGLGLAICRKIAEIHSGSIRAESAEGHGSTFYVSFPNYLKA
jgi:light-regulated signal transduction histidine kinase (bacteriophytochrome)